MIIEHEENPSWLTPGTAPTPAKREIDEIEALLRRYPHLNAAETQRCIDYVAKAPIADRGSLSARPGMADKMAQLRRDHPKPFKPSLASYAVFGTLIVAVVLSGFMVAG
jgi:hypothetical protein